MKGPNTRNLGPLRTPQAPYVVGKGNMSPKIEGVCMGNAISTAAAPIKSPLTGMKNIRNKR